MCFSQPDPIDTLNGHVCMESNFYSITIVMVESYPPRLLKLRYPPRIRGIAGSITGNVPNGWLTLADSELSGPKV